VFQQVISSHPSVVVFLSFRSYGTRISTPPLFFLKPGAYLLTDCCPTPTPPFFFMCPLSGSISRELSVALFVFSFSFPWQHGSFPPFLGFLFCAFLRNVHVPASACTTRKASEKADFTFLPFLSSCGLRAFRFGTEAFDPLELNVPVLCSYFFLDSLASLPGFPRSWERNFPFEGALSGKVSRLHGWTMVSDLSTPFLRLPPH